MQRELLKNAIFSLSLSLSSGERSFFILRALSTPLVRQSLMPPLSEACLCPSPRESKRWMLFARNIFIALETARSGQSERNAPPPLSLCLCLSWAKRFTVPLSEERNVRRAAMQLHMCRCILDA